MKENNSSESKNMEAQASAVVTMDTEAFHNALVANTELINKERMRYEMRKANAKKQLDSLRDANSKSLQELEREIMEFKELYARKRAEWNEAERRLRDFRRKAQEDYCFEMTSAKSDHSRVNQALQNERHLIYEQYRNSGGQVSPDTQVMQPDWKRKDADDIGMESPQE